MNFLNFQAKVTKLVNSCDFRIRTKNDIYLIVRYKNSFIKTEKYCRRSRGFKWIENLKTKQNALIEDLIILSMNGLIENRSEADFSTRKEIKMQNFKSIRIYGHNFHNNKNQEVHMGHKWKI